MAVFNTRLFSYFPIPEYIDIDTNFLPGSGLSRSLGLYWQLLTPHSPPLSHQLGISMVFKALKPNLNWKDLYHKTVSNDIAFESLCYPAGPQVIRYI